MAFVDIEDPVEVHTTQSVWKIDPFMRDGVRCYRATKMGVKDGAGENPDFPIGHFEEGNTLFLEKGRSFELGFEGKILVSSEVKDFFYIEPHH